MAVAAAGSTTAERAAFAREARAARVAALVLDVFIFGVITGVVNGVYGETEITSGFFSPSGSVMSTTTSVAWPWLTLLGVLYFTIPEAMFGASLGKHLMRLRVVRLGGGPLAVRDTIIRNVLKPIDFLPILYLLGGLLVVVTPGSQRLGDLAAGTTVFYRHRVLGPGATRSSTPRAKKTFLIGLLALAVVTGGFEYLGRPRLVIDGMFKEQRLVNPDLQSYSLGPPAWGLGTVTYPLSGRTATEKCSGTVQLSWQLVGWVESTSQLLCVPS